MLYGYLLGFYDSHTCWQIIDPWGRILSRCPSIDDLQQQSAANGTDTTQTQNDQQQEQQQQQHFYHADREFSLCVATVDPALLKSVRRRMPVQQHRLVRPWQPVFPDGNKS